MKLHLLSTEIAILLVGILIIVLELFLKNRRILGIVSFVGLFLVLVLSMFSYSNTGIYMHGMLKATHLLRIFDILIILGTLMVVWLSIDFFGKERSSSPLGKERSSSPLGKDTPEGYFFFLLMSLLGSLLVVKSRNLAVLFLSIELVSFSLIPLIGYSKSKEREASLKFFILNAVSSSFLLAGIAFVYGATGTMDIGGVFESIKTGIANFPLLKISLVFFIIGFGFKLAFVPFHFWTPDVFEGAPLPVVAFISTVPKIAGFAIFLSIYQIGKTLNIEVWSSLIVIISVSSMVIGNVSALKEFNLKRMLAYSTIAHAGYVLLAIISETERGYAVVLFYLLAYTFSTVGAFAVLCAERAEHLDEIKGLLERRPLLAFFMAIFMISLAGIPPVAGFIAKFFVFSSLVKVNLLNLTFIGLVMSVISAYYYLRVVVYMFMIERKGESPEYGMFIGGVLWLCIFIVFLLGITPKDIWGLFVYSLR